MDTMPQDVVELPTPSEEPVPTCSTHLDSDQRRAQYQGCKNDLSTTVQFTPEASEADTEKPDTAVADLGKVRTTESSVPKKAKKATEAEEQETFTDSDQEAGDTQVEHMSNIANMLLLNHEFYLNIIFDIFGVLGLSPTNQTGFFILVVFCSQSFRWVQADYVKRREQLEMQPSSRGRGRGRGKGKGRGRGCGKLEEFEEEERTDMGDKPKEKHRKTSKRKHKKCKDTADSGPEWNEEMTEEWAKWKWGEVWAEWYEDDKWDCCDAKRSADRAANLDAQVSLHQLATAAKKHKGSKPATDKTNPDDNAGDDNQETKTTDGKKQIKTRDRAKTEKAKSKSKKRHAQEEEEEKETTSRKRKKEKDVEQAVFSDPVPKKERDQVNMIASFIKEFEGLKIKNIQALTPDDRDKLKGMEYVAEETRYNRYYKRPAFGLHSYVEKKDVVYFHVDGCARDFLYRFAASMKAASMMVTRMNHMHLSRCILCGRCVRNIVFLRISHTFTGIHACSLKLRQCTSMKLRESREVLMQ
jgi:hypothetical protein